MKTLSASLVVTLAGCLLLVAGCGNGIEDLPGAFTLLEQRDPSASGIRICRFSTDEKLGDELPASISAPSNSNTQKIRTGINQEVKTTEVAADGRGFVIRALFSLLWCAAAVTLIGFALVGASGKERSVLSALPWLAAAGTLAWLVLSFAPPWCFVWLQGLGAFVMIPAIALIDEHSHEVRRTVLTVCIALLVLAIAIQAGRLAGERIVVDNATGVPVTVMVTDSRGVTTHLQLESGTFSRVRLSGSSWEIATSDEAGLVERLTVSIRPSFIGGILRWFFVPGELCYNVAGANEYEVIRAVYI